MAVIAVSPTGTRMLTRKWRSSTNQRGNEPIELCTTSTGRWPSNFETFEYKFQDSRPHTVAAHSVKVEGAEDNGEGDKEGDCVDLHLQAKEKEGSRQRSKRSGAAH